MKDLMSLILVMAVICNQMQMLNMANIKANDKISNALAFEH